MECGGSHFSHSPYWPHVGDHHFDRALPAAIDEGEVPTFDESQSDAKIDYPIDVALPPGAYSSFGYLREC